MPLGFVESAEPCLILLDRRHFVTQGARSPYIPEENIAVIGSGEKLALIMRAPIESVAFVGMADQPELRMRLLGLGLGRVLGVVPDIHI